MISVIKKIYARSLDVLHEKGIVGLGHEAWGRFWMKWTGTGFWGRSASRLAAIGISPYMGRYLLANFTHKGYIAPSANISHSGLTLGKNVCINDRVTIHRARKGGPVKIDDRVIIYFDTIIQTGDDGSVTIGAHSSIHPRCLLSAYVSSIHIGSGVMIAPNCAFYSYNHSLMPGEPIRKQPIRSKGDIVIGDEAWFGFGAIVLDGVKIGSGAVIGAGAVVMHDIPEGGIVVGNPARIVGNRSDLGRT